MRTLIAIVEDLVAWSSPTELAWEVGAENTEHLEEAVLEYINREGKTDPKHLGRWIAEWCGKSGLRTILDQRGLEFDRSFSALELIDVWFADRELDSAKPRARPGILIKRILEITNTAQITPEKLPDVMSLLKPLLRLLLRYLGYFYASDLLGSDDQQRLCGDGDFGDVTAALEKLELTQLCELIACDRPLRTRPYVAQCESTVNLAEGTASHALARLSRLTGDTQQDHMRKEREFTECVAELLEHWLPQDEKQVIPKGAVVTECHMTGFFSHASCDDEFDNCLTLTGMKKPLSVGDSLLLSSTEIEKSWAPDLLPVPDSEVWTTPASLRPSPSVNARGAPVCQSQQRQRRKVFLSYSRGDRPWLERARSHLKVLEMQGLLELWAADRIEPGRFRQTDINKAVDSTRVAILFISPDYLASDHINGTELPALKKAAAAEKIDLIPLYVRPSLHESCEVSNLRGANRPDEPLSKLDDNAVDLVLVALTQAVKRLFESTQT